MLMSVGQPLVWEHMFVSVTNIVKLCHTLTDTLGNKIVQFSVCCCILAIIIVNISPLSTCVGGNKVDNRVWTYRNITTGNELECNDLTFMAHQLKHIKGIDIPVTELANLQLTGKTRCVVMSSCGEMNEVTIEESVSTGERFSFM